MKYKSSVLRCCVDDECCDVCRFLNGDRSEEVLLAVIDRLDQELALGELVERTMLGLAARRLDQGE